MPSAANRSWHFLLSGSGSHELKVDGLDRPVQVVYLDGNRLDEPPGTRAFNGPDGSLLELERDAKAPTGWALRVNGCIVEELGTTIAEGALAGRNRRLPDGAYTIAPQFSPEGRDLDLTHRFDFTARGESCTAQVYEGMIEKVPVWDIVVNGTMQRRVRKEKKVDSAHCSFWHEAPSGDKLLLEFRLERGGKCTLSVNHVSVQCCWMNGREIHLSPNVACPEVVAAV
mmetsp:Transcript_41944/g.96249  ORF Transcript_41944/g.96249 Transcript_41944/m.96249 type:complete len:227 (-) Transcript_41944:115-795(-)